MDPCNILEILHELEKWLSHYKIKGIGNIDYNVLPICMEEKRQINAQLIGQNIRRIRLEHGETQQQLGALLGYGATTIANYETGYRMPDLETFFQIALHYGASLEDFIREQETAIPDESQNGFI